MGYDCEKALDYYEEQIDRLRSFLEGRPIDQKKDLIEALEEYIVELENASMQKERKY